ncbi:MAG: hypothetical protein N2323_00570 [candidate division WOR-3 bacterium]|nr:hypothetical protein [candidate division WOR-3 bacterium]MCX7836438.1 hypothetical protein [candidate division WOR-3 bacterium]MDW8114216.1 hypothetical protein [candidate division WOR-3 bacterium]
MVIIFQLLFFYFSQADLYGEFILINEIGSFIPPKTSFFSLLSRKRSLLFLENQNRIILYSEGIFKPLIFDIEGNYLGYLETSFYHAQKIRHKKKEIIVIPFGNVLEFYTLKNRTLSLHQRLLINEYIESFNFLVKDEDSFFIILSCSNKGEGNIKIYNHKFKLIAEKLIKGKFFINNLFDTLILGIEKNFRKIILLDINLKILWEFNLEDLLITDYSVMDNILVLATSDEKQEKGRLYFLSLKNGKLLEIFPLNSFYSSGFKSVKIEDIDNDKEKEIIVGSGGKKGEIFIFKKLKDKLTLKKKKVFLPKLPLVDFVNIVILEINDFVYDKDKNKELLFLITYEQKTKNLLPNNFISGEVLLLDKKLKEIADLSLNFPIKDYLIVNKKNKKEMVLVLLAEKLKFYE